MRRISARLNVPIMGSPSSPRFHRQGPKSGTLDRISEIGEGWHRRIEGDAT